MSGLDSFASLLEPDKFDLIKFTEAFVALFATPISALLPMRLVGTILPKLSISTNLELIEPLIEEDLPNYNTEFHVDGVEDGRVAWLVEAENRTSDDPVIFYAHGGGYVFGLFPNFPYLFATIYKWLGNDRLSILLLDYTLATDGTYPQQIIEFTLSYNKLAESSVNIIIAGDSAGGHLSLAFVRHQSYKPFEEVPEAVNQKPTGAILLFPWVNLYPQDGVGSYKTNSGKDILGAPILRHFTEVFLPDKSLYELPKFNPYNDTIGWDSILPETIFVSKGENEVLRDDITKWTELAELNDSEVYESPDAIHDSAIFTPKLSDITPEIVKYLKSLGYW